MGALNVKNMQIRGQLTWAWIAISIAWSLIRSLVIRRVFGPHGTNSWVYLVIDFSTTIPYAIYSAKAVFAWIDKSSEFRRYLFISAACFIAPDLYVALTARRVSLDVWIGFGLFVFILASLAVLKGRSDQRKNLN